CPRTARTGDGVPTDFDPGRATMSTPNLAGHLQRFFTDRLLGQLGASPHTVASYRDTFRLLLKFASKERRRQASDLRVEDLDAQLVGSFLKHLEHDRRNSARSRNNRLSAIHAFFGYVCLNEPALACHCQRVLAMPFKRFEQGPVVCRTTNRADNPGLSDSQGYCDEFRCAPETGCATCQSRPQNVSLLANQ